MLRIASEVATSYDSLMRRFFSAVICTLCISLSSHCLGAETKPKVLPDEWLPALSPSINTALEDLKAANAQAEMNAISRQIAELTDAQLLIAYVRLYERLSATEREKLFDEQTLWLKARPRAAKKGVDSEGGSLAPLEANNAEVTYTEKRLSELRVRFKAAEKKK